MRYSAVNCMITSITTKCTKIKSLATLVNSLTEITDGREVAFMTLANSLVNGGKLNL